jgi:hypothetical protein
MSQGVKVFTFNQPIGSHVLRGSTGLRLLSLLVVAAVAAGCAPRDAEVRLARAAAERRSMEQLLDQLEDRLLVNQARVRFWQEMKERHESVTAIACVSLQAHAVEMAARSSPTHSSLHRARVASATAADGERPQRQPAFK